MLIKSADDNAQAVETLTALLDRKNLRGSTRKLIEQELRNIQAGSKGERDAAYEIEFYYATSPNVTTIHDLRLEFGGRVAQIDHLIINRFLDIWVCESKSFAQGVAINEHGEWSAYYGRSSRGIPSPIEQNNRHVAVLQEVLAKGPVRLPKRLGRTLEPTIKPIVLISNSGKIARPKAWSRVAGGDTVVKAEQLYATINRSIDEKKVSAILSFVGRETVEDLARQLAALHTPKAFDWEARFGIEPDVELAKSLDAPLAAPAPETRPEPSSAEVLPNCASCSKPVSAKVADYCRANSRHFDARILCFDCQRSARRMKPGRQTG